MVSREAVPILRLLQYCHFVQKKVVKEIDTLSGEATLSDLVCLSSEKGSTLRGDICPEETKTGSSL